MCSSICQGAVDHLNSESITVLLIQLENELFHPGVDSQCVTEVFGKRCHWTMIGY